MEDAFAGLYRGLLARIEPDPARLREGRLKLFLRKTDDESLRPVQSDLYSGQICDIRYAERNGKNETRKKAGNEA